MPGFTTHYIIGTRAFRDLSDGPLKSILSENSALYQLGVQGPDLFFYNFLLLRHSRENNIGILMHEFHINAFFANLFDALSQEADPVRFDMAAAYTAGYMCHYISDSFIHPYVYGRIGHSPKEKQRRQKSLTTSLHCQLENDIDAILLQRFGNKRPSEFNQAATFSLSKEERRFISHMLSNTINKTYFPARYGNTYSITNGVVARSIWLMHIGCRILSDPHASKRNKLQRLERLFHRSSIVSNKLVTDDISDVNWALNTGHEPWVNPWDRSMVSQESLTELLQKTLAKLHDCFLLFDRLVADHALNAEERAELLSELGNYSLHSGLSAGTFVMPRP